MFAGNTFGPRNRLGFVGSSLVLTWTMTSRGEAAPSIPPTADGIAAAGLSAYESGRYEEANEKLSRALDLVGVPTLSLYAARTNVKLGNWVKASELYLLAARLNPKSAANIPHLQAQYEAERERGPLLARIPRLTIVLEGEDLDSVEVTLDSIPVPKALLGANQLVDPGHHVVRATRDGQVVTGEIDLLEQQHKTTRLHFGRRETRDAAAQTLPSISTTTLQRVGQASAPDSPVAAANAPGLGDAPERHDGGKPPDLLRDIGRDPLNATWTPAPTSASRGDVTKDDAARDDDTTLRTLGWIGIGVGGTGIVIGAVTGLMAATVRSDLLSSGTCSGAVCYADASDDVARYGRLRDWSTIGFVSGGLLAAAGTTLLLLNPAKSSAPQASLAVSPGSVSVTGAF